MHCFVLLGVSSIQLKLNRVAAERCYLISEFRLKEQGKVRLYYRTDPDFSGIAPGAMWDDFKVGVEHLFRWERFAVVSDIDWIRYSLRAFSFLIPGMVKFFHLSEEAKAREWILEGMPH